MIKKIICILIALITIIVIAAAQINYVWSNDVNITNTGIIKIHVKGDYVQYDVPIYTFHDVSANKTCYVLLGRDGIGGQPPVLQCV